MRRNCLRIQIFPTVFLLLVYQAVAQIKAGEIGNLEKLIDSVYFNTLGVQSKYLEKSEKSTRKKSASLLIFFEDFVNSKKLNRLVDEYLSL
jgi:hypothetical protein